MRAGLIKPGRDYDFVAQTLLPRPINQSWQVRLPMTAWRFGAGSTTLVSGRAFVIGVQSLQVFLTDFAKGIKAGTSKPTVIGAKMAFHYCWFLASTIAFLHLCFALAIRVHGMPVVHLSRHLFMPLYAAVPSCMDIIWMD